uniref:MICOS complex subunit MIC13 n=1 Tax=Timema bartmani TaxID=61472 RepID=A0A7R9EWF3_9NEOP|nr:unnamed protein product [Timema bartmani]
MVKFCGKRVPVGVKATYRGKECFKPQAIQKLVPNTRQDDGCAKTSSPEPLFYPPRIAPIRVCTPEDMKRLCPPEPCKCPDRVEISPLQVAGKGVWFLMKAAMAGGLLYFTVTQGLWQDQEETTNLYVRMHKSALIIFKGIKPTEEPELCPASVIVWCNTSLSCKDSPTLLGTYWSPLTNMNNDQPKCGHSPILEDTCQIESHLPSTVGSLCHESKLLGRSKHWYADSTFKTVPPVFGQLYTIHEFEANNSIPLVYTILADKRQRTYSRLLRKVNELEPASSPRTFMTDFEMSMINAVKAIKMEQSLNEVRIEQYIGGQESRQRKKYRNSMKAQIVDNTSLDICQVAWDHLTNLIASDGDIGRRILIGCTEIPKGENVVYCLKDSWNKGVKGVFSFLVNLPSSVANFPSRISEFRQKSWAAFTGQKEPEPKPDGITE